MNNEMSSKGINNNNNNEHYESYYANYTSKLYDNSEQGEEVPTTGYNYISSTAKVESPQKGKYNVTLDDGMSSNDFLSQLKNLKAASPFVKTENNF